MSMSDMPGIGDVFKATHSITSHRICEITNDGNFTFHGFDMDEIKDLLAAHREHLQALASLITGQDAVRYQPVGPEDIEREAPFNVRDMT